MLWQSLLFFLFENGDRIYPNKWLLLAVKEIMYTKFLSKSEENSKYPLRELTNNSDHVYSNLNCFRRTVAQV